MNRVRPLLVLLLLLAGARLAIWSSDATHSSALYHGTPTFLLVILLTSVAAGLIMASPAGVALGRIGERPSAAHFLSILRDPSPAARRAVTVAVWLLATLYLAWTAHRQGRALFPLLHDENSYALGARMLSRGHLWLPAHPLADFLDSFHILVRPVYASIYFPGTALLNVPAVWLGLPTWVIPVVTAGLVVALTYRVTAELAGGATGLLAALLVPSVGLFRMFSTMVMAQAPAALLALAAVWAWLHWRRRKRAGWAMLAGAFVGWGAITRPVDGLVFAIPLAVAIALDLRGSPRREWLRTMAAIAAGALPFLSLQVVFNLGTTGRLTLTPYVLYLRQSQPGSEFGSGSFAPQELQTTLPQKADYYHELVEDEQAERAAGTGYWLGRRVAFTVTKTLPSAALAALLPVGVFAAGRRRRWVLGAAPLLFLIAYALNPFYLVHYAVPLVPAIAFLVALGVGEMASAARAALRPAAARAAAAVFFPLAAAALAARALPEFDRNVSDATYSAPDVAYAHGPMTAAVQPPAVVFFRYGPGSSPHDEPVYNTDTARPDDTPVLRLHDLGPRNREVVQYFADKQPGRRFYRYDRASGVLTPLGTAAELAAGLGPEGQPPPPPATRGAE